MRVALLLVLVIASGPGCSTTDCAGECGLDAAIDAPTVPAGAGYVIDKVLVPTSNTQARTFGFNLDDDSLVDNQLGMTLSTLVGMGFDPQAVMTNAVDHGDIIMLARLGALDFTTDAAATFTIVQGENPMPSPCTSAQDVTCRKHLTGTGSFSVKPSSPIDPPLTGMITAGKLQAGPGHLTIQFSMAFSPPITVTLLGARVELMTTMTALDGKLGGGITKLDMDTKVLPAMRDGAQALVARDCTMLMNPPSCGCASDTDGRSLLGLFDTTPQDCVISLSEVQNNSLLQTLFVPDLMIEGQQALSIGFAVTAVPGGFAQPM